MRINPGLRPYQDIVSIADVPDDHMREFLAALLEYLQVNIVREQTPDYTAYEIRPRDYYEIRSRD